jgi:hypothetical protein
VLNERRTKELKHLPTNWRSHIQILLQKEYPERDHQETLDFLNNDRGGLPIKGGGKALYNAFIAYQKGVGTSAVKKERWKMGKLREEWFSNGQPLSDEEVEKEIDEVMQGWTQNLMKVINQRHGFSVIPPDIDLTDSSLVFLTDDDMAEELFRESLKNPVKW